MRPRSSLPPLEGLCRQCARSLYGNAKLDGSRIPHASRQGVPRTLQIAYPLPRSLHYSSRASVNLFFTFSLSRRTFHTSPTSRAEPANHYEILGVAPDASQAEIKQQFYHLSKLHHPDHNPHDRGASSRFQAISSAYHILGVPTRRQQYDRDSGFTPSHSSSRGAPAYSGSYSSSQRGSGSGPYGARPASGLNKRRGTFRGPPPSFYASGGWGSHANKRRAAQKEGASAAFSGAEKSAESSEEGYGGSYASGYGAGGASWGQGMPGTDVPHFDRQSHFERHEEMDERMAKRKQARRLKLEREQELLQRDWAMRLVLVAIVVGLAAVVDALVIRPTRNVGEARKEKGSR